MTRQHASPPARSFRRPTRSLMGPFTRWGPRFWMGDIKSIFRAAFLLGAALILSGCASPSAKVGQVRVLCYNIRHGRGMDGRIDLERTARVIKSVQPDLVAVLEIDRATRRSAGVDQVAELARLTGMTYYFGKCRDYQGGEFGQAVLSKWPLTNEVLPLPGSPEFGARILQINRVQPPSGIPDLMFLSTHLSHGVSPADRLAQIEFINQWLQTQSPDTLAILTGDFNATPESEELQRLLPHWRDVGAVNSAATFKADQPRIRIDYIFARPASRWRIIQTYVLDDAVTSDHRPVFAVLKATAQ